MASCRDYRPLIGSFEDELEPAERAALDAHLAGCAACRAWAADLAATEGLLPEALLAAAARRDLAPFVDGVMARVAESREGLLRRLARMVRLHPRLALATAAPIVAVAALSVYIGIDHWGTDLADASQVEVTTQGHATTILESRDGPLVLLNDDDEAG